MKVGGTALVLVAVLALVVPAAGQEEEEGSPNSARAETIEIGPSDGAAAIVLDGTRYGGSIRITGHPNGLAVVEAVDVDSYLAGIQEVPLEWEPAALEAQVIAARTYLASTLAGGRTSSGRAYDYDICATDACQVYAGLEPTLGQGGDRWLSAVESTTSQILLFDGEPAQAYYSSTSGGRTRTASDVWPDTDLPYLQAVDSPGEASPFADWVWRLPQRHMQRLMDEAGLTTGELARVTTSTRGDGEGPWTVTVHSPDGDRTVDTWTLRGTLNRAGPAALPGVLPAVRPDGPRYPQTILSPTYTIETYRLPLLSPGGPSVLSIYEADGKGWGHLIGMSQYGAQAMAERGATAAEILSHFYGGLVPEEAPRFVPETVEVALALGAGGFDIDVTGPVDVTVDGQSVASEELGSWSVTADRGSIEVAMPEGLGLPPRLRPRASAQVAGWRLIRFELTAAAEVTWQATSRGEVVADSAPVTLDAGFVTVPVPALGVGSVTIEAVNAHGSDRVTVAGSGPVPDSG